MKYLVNRETKEHIVYNGINHHGSMVDDWQVIEADAEGWIKWDQSSECPLPDECRVEIKNANSKTCPFIIAAHQYYWRFIDSYRPILDKPEVRVTDEWVGEAENANPVYVGATLEHKPDLIDRLKSAHEAAQSIPDLLAELREALGPIGYDVVARSPFVGDDRDDFTGELPDMSDWRNWEKGDLVELCEGIGDGHIFKRGVLYTVHSVSKYGYALKYGRGAPDVCPILSRVNDFRFHSRPEKTK